MGNPLNLKINTRTNIYNSNHSPTRNVNYSRYNNRHSPNYKGTIPQNHIDIGPGVCPNNLDHHVHIVLHEGTNIPILYKCSKCRYQQIIDKRNIKN